MTDLDIDIDIPDDNGLDAPPPVLDRGDRATLWPRLAAGATVVVLAIAAYGYHTSPEPEPTATPEPAVTATATTAAPTTTPAPGPEVTRTLDAVAAWERFARTGDLVDLATAFDPNGPQYTLFVGQATAWAATDTPAFHAANISVRHGEDQVRVSTDLTVTRPDGATVVYPYDFVYLRDTTAVWTVVDRRTPDTPALPPPADVIDAAQQAWAALGAALASDGTNAIAGLVSTTGGPPTFSQTQTDAITTGRLHTWTQTGPNQVIPTLALDGVDVSTVAFTAVADLWLFDLDATTNIATTP